MYFFMFVVIQNIGLYNYYGCFGEKKYSKVDRIVID